MKLHIKSKKRLYTGTIVLVGLYLLHFIAIKVMASLRIVESLMTNGGFLSAWIFLLAVLFIAFRVFVIVALPGILFYFFWRNVTANK